MPDHEKWPELAAKYDADQAPPPAVDEAEHDKLKAEVEPWLQVCGSCDYGVSGCTCPEGDVRPVMLRLWEAYEAARDLVAKPPLTSREPEGGARVAMQRWYADMDDS